MNTERTITLNNVLLLLEKKVKEQNALCESAFDRHDLHTSAKHDAIGDGVILAMHTLVDWIASNE